MPRFTRNSSTITKDAPYPPPFLLQTDGMDKAASTSRLITPSKPTTNSNMEEDAVDEKGFPPVAIGGNGDDPMDGFVGEPDPEFEDSTTVAGGDGGVPSDEVISVGSGEDSGGDAGTGTGTDGAKERAGGMDTGDLQVY